MAIVSGSLIEISMVQDILGQQTMNVWQYVVGGLIDFDSAGDVAEAWWNHVKTAYRGVPVTSFLNAFRSVRLRELNDPTGDYAEYAVPTLEQPGTRALPVGSEKMPPFTCAGVRLTVGSRLTRPGQKRLAGLCEADNIDGYLQSAASAAVNSLMAVMTAQMVLGAPAALMTLQPIVCRRDASGAVVANQFVTGHVLNGFVTTQNSRKFGRGA